jgi:exoribonuclease R
MCYDPEHHRWANPATGAEYRLGQRVVVELRHVDTRHGRVVFVIV